ncbi:MAG: dipeptidase [Rhizobiales bacterium]|nr:dipeptidase [Hyphomicrobiales bacterium]
MDETPNTPTRGLIARAKRLLAEVGLFDGHNDLPYVIREDAEARGDLDLFALRRNLPGRDTDIPKLRAGRVCAQFFAAYVPPDEPKPASYALQQIGLVRRVNGLHDDVFLPATKAADVARARRAGKIASFVTVENGAALEGRLDTLDAFYDLGVRLMTLCHNNSTDWCDSATDAPRHGGLSRFGREVIGRMNRLGMIVDLAHVAPTVMHQTLDVSDAPVVWSHSNARKLCDHPRNVPEDVLDRVAGAGGVVMATFVPDFISEASRAWTAPFKDEWGKTRSDIKGGWEKVLAKHAKTAGPWPKGDLAQYCDHLDYLRGRIGADHIGVGSDFFGGPQGAGLENASCFPGVFAELMTRGWSDDDLAKLASGNILRVMREVEKAAR